MIFWILVVLLAVVVIAVFIKFAFFDDLMNDSIWERAFAFLPAMIAALLGGIIAGGMLLLFLLIPSTLIRPHTYGLTSLGSTQGVEGHLYFLGSGTINGTRELTYVKHLDGYDVATEAEGDASRIYQGIAKPTVTEYEFVYSNGWVLPWEFDTGWSYDFHVPSGSILNDYKVGAQ